MTMNHSTLHRFKAGIRRIWVLSPERLWLSSIALDRRGHWVLAFALKQINGLIYKNSLAPGATVSPDIHLGHNSIGIVINRNVEIGSHVTIWHNVTLAAGRPERRERPVSAREAEERESSRARIIVEDHVKIGTGAVVIAPRGRTVRIGRAARIGPGTVVTQDVPAFATVLGAAPRVMSKEEFEQREGES